jgi:hypothetical protein
VGCRRCPARTRRCRRTTATTRGAAR